MFIVMPLLIAAHVFVCLLMVLVVLMQRPRSEGLGAAFGGGVTDNIFGAQATQVLGKFTTWLAGGFFALTLLLSILTAKTSGGVTPVQQKLLDTPEPAPAASPAVPAPPAPVTTPDASQQVAPPVVESAPSEMAPAAQPSSPATPPAEQPSSPATPPAENVAPATPDAAPATN